MNYLVTGGAGFIGSHIVEQLLKKGHHVRVFDNLSTGNREHLFEGAEFIEGDILDMATLSRAMNGVDGIFHLAAMPSVSQSIDDPRTTHDVNATGTLNVFLAAKANGIKTVVFSSSSAIYGDTIELPTQEEVEKKPLNPYALQKWIGELYAEQCARLYGMNIRCLRYFNAYGPRMAETGAYVNVMSIFVQKARKGEPLTIYGDGTQSRDFVHVRDIAEANILAMQNTTQTGYTYFNIGSGVSQSVLRIVEEFNSPAIHIENPRGKGEPPATLADTSKAKTLLGWEAKVPFSEGIHELLTLWGIR